MSARTKKRPIEIVINGDTVRRFSGAKKNLPPLLKALPRYGFEPVKDRDFTSWASLAGKRIEQYGQPGLALRGARKRQSLTQVDLGMKMGVRQENISKMERGQRPIGKEMAKRLARVLKVDYRVFL